MLLDAERLGWAPLQAEARLAVGDLQERRGRYTLAGDSLRDAFFEAGEIGHDLVALKAATKLTWTLGLPLGEHEAGLRWGQIARMFVERLSLQDTLHEAKLLNAIAAIHFRRGEFDPAARDFAAAARIREAQLGPEHPLVAAALNNIGLVQNEQAQVEDARVSLSRALAIREAALGPEHPTTAASLSNLGLVLMQAKDYDGALELARRGLEILEAGLSPGHPSLASSYNNVGLILEHQGRYDEALETHERGLAIREAAFGPEAPSLAINLTNIGTVQLARGEISKARAAFTRAMALPGRESRIPRSLARNQFGLAQVIWASERSPRAQAEALGLARRAAENYRQSGASQAEALAAVEAWLAEREHPVSKPER